MQKCPLDIPSGEGQTQPVAVVQFRCCILTVCEFSEGVSHILWSDSTAGVFYLQENMTSGFLLTLSY